MSNKTSDKNVGSIEDIRDLLLFFKSHGWIPDIRRTINVTNVILAIDNVLQEREQDKKRIQELEEELEKANKQLDLDYVDDNYITKEKVKDKIEKYNRKMEEDVGRPKRKIEKMKCGICKKEIPKKQVRLDNMHYEFDEETEKLFTVDRQDSVTVCQKCYANLIWD